MSDANPQGAIPEERRQGIIAEVGRHPLVRANELARRFGVSVETIRRDLVVLEREGLVRRVYGGATRIVPHAFEPSFEERRVRNLKQKRAMGRIAASLVRATDTVILDVGTSVLEVARNLPASYRGLVLTNSLLAATELAGRSGVEVLTSGGRVRGGDLACSGPQAQQFFRDFYADKAFLGSGGIDLAAGLTDYYPEEIACRQIMLEHAAEVYVMADSSKLGKVAVGRVCGLEEITGVITDEGADDEVLEDLERAGIEVFVAPPDDG